MVFVLLFMLLCFCVCAKYRDNIKKKIKSYIDTLIFNGLIYSITLSYIDICLGWTSNYTFNFRRQENIQGAEELGAMSYI